MEVQNGSLVDHLETVQSEKQSLLLQLSEMQQQWNAANCSNKRLIENMQSVRALSQVISSIGKHGYFPIFAAMREVVKCWCLCAVPLLSAFCVSLYPYDRIDYVECTVCRTAICCKNAMRPARTTTSIRQE